MNTRELKFRAIWWPATTFSSRLPISRAITEKMLASANTEMPIGRPTPSSGRIAAGCGASKRANSWLLRYTGAQRTHSSMPPSRNHITSAVAQPQPTPPMAGTPSLP